MSVNQLWFSFRINLAPELFLALDLVPLRGREPLGDVVKRQIVADDVDPDVPVPGQAAAKYRRGMAINPHRFGPAGN